MRKLLFTTTALIASGLVAAGAAQAQAQGQMQQTRTPGTMQQQAQAPGQMGGQMGTRAGAQNWTMPAVGAWELTLSGSGSSDKDFDNNIIGLTGSIGQYMMPNVLVGVRQSLNYRRSPATTQLAGATRIFADYVFDMGQFRPFVGASLGGIYGDGVNDSFTAGPEVGAKWYMTQDAFLYGQADYQFTFESGDDLTDSFRDGGFFYSIGVGMNF